MYCPHKLQDCPFGNHRLIQAAIQEKKAIGFFFPGGMNGEPDEFGNLSNYGPHSFLSDDGFLYPTREHCYQAQKLDPAQKSQVLSLTPDEARKFCNKNLVVQNWHDIKGDVMAKTLAQCYEQNSSFKALLDSTKGKALYEISIANDDMFFGIGKNGEGRNELGKLLESVRDKSAKI